MDRAFAKYLIEELKTDVPVPPETCPLIDGTIKMLRLLQVDGVAAVIENLEQLRKENRTPRDLGREWYQLADDLANQFPTRRTNCRR